MNRKQRRRASALQRKEMSETRQKWESRVVEAFIELGWTENQVRSHMRNIKTLPLKFSSYIHGLSPRTYVESILDELSEQSEMSK